MYIERDWVEVYVLRVTLHVIRVHRTSVRNIFIGSIFRAFFSCVYLRNEYQQMKKSSPVFQAPWPLALPMARAVEYLPALFKLADLEQCICFWMADGLLFECIWLFIHTSISTCCKGIIFTQGKRMYVHLDASFMLLNWFCNTPKNISIVLVDIYLQYELGFPLCPSELKPRRGVRWSVMQMTWSYWVW